MGRLLAHLEQRLAELDRLHREIAEDALALAHGCRCHTRGSRQGRARSVYSSRAAEPSWG
jgi:hypothetical protein